MDLNIEIEAKTKNKEEPRHQIFISPKSTHPIRYSQRWHRDALVQLSLDPSVIGFEAESGPLPLEVLNLVVTIPAGQMRVSLVRDRAHSTETDPAKDRIKISRQTVLQEPRASNARAIWSARNTFVSIGDKFRILRKLEDAPEGLEFAELLLCISTSRSDPVDAILALVCQGWIILEIEKPIAPSTTVRRPSSPTSRPMPDPKLKEAVGS
jgi:hypothetical protein